MTIICKKWWSTKLFKYFHIYKNERSEDYKCTLCITVGDRIFFLFLKGKYKFFYTQLVDLASLNMDT